MPIASIISDVRFASYHARANTSGGLLGFVAVTVGGTWRIDGIAVRHSADGRIVLSFPERRDSSGRRHPIVRPVDAASRAAIEGAILQALGFAESGAA